MTSELTTVYGSISGTGDYSLSSDMFANSVSYIRIPKGMKAKIWAKRFTGDAAGKTTIYFTHDVTQGSPTWTPLSSTYLAAAGEIDLEKQSRPIKVMGYNGTEAIKITSDSGTGNYTFEMDVELSDE